MKLQPDTFDVQAITGYGPGWVGVNGERIQHSVIIASGGQRIAWPVQRFDELRAEHFAPLATVDAEVAIFGSGSRIRFPRPAWLAPLIEKKNRARDHGHGSGLPHLQHFGPRGAPRRGCPSA